MLSIRSMPTYSSSYGKGNKSRKMVEKEQTEHGSKDMAIRDEDKYFCWPNPVWDSFDVCMYALPDDAWHYF